jgi:thiosulfate dehydrogenase [quinone] large subunit
MIIIDGRTLMLKSITTTNGRVITDPPLARFLFSDVRMSWLWLVLRVWVGYQWLNSGLGKATNPAWVQTGEALKGYWTNAVKIPAEGKPPITFEWYRDFINFLLTTESYTWFAKLIVAGEILVGVALVLGAFVGIAAFFGATMNWNFIMAGSASSNGLMLVIAILLILAWKTAGYIGLDYILLRWLGVPWQPRHQEQAPVPDIKLAPALE